MRPGAIHGCRWVVLLLTAVVSHPALAQLGPNGSLIRTSRYSVDLHQGVVLASTRLIGLGGAYVAIAEGVEGNYVNPATPAVRLPWSTTHQDYDLAGGMTFPGTLASSDFFNSGSNRTNLSTSDSDAFLFLDGEGHIQVGRWGVGTALTFQQYGLQRVVRPQAEAKRDRVRAQFWNGTVHLARSILDGQVVLGVGLRGTSFSVVNQSGGLSGIKTLFSTQGYGTEAGILLRPNYQPFRVGGAVRTAVTTRAELSQRVPADASGDRVLAAGTPDEMYLPNHVSLPWDFSVGIAWQFGTRPFNPVFVDPEDRLARMRRLHAWRARERERQRQQRLARVRATGGNEEAARQALDAEQAMQAALDETERRTLELVVDRELRNQVSAQQRWYVLVTTALRVTGPVDDAVGVESFLQRTVDRSGRRTVYSPHLGLESEVIPRWLRLRVGAYLEPTRFENQRAASRLHATWGAEQKLFAWRVFGLYGNDRDWRVQAALDLSERYFGWSASVGVWH